MFGIAGGRKIIAFRRGLGRLISAFGTDPNRRFEDIIERIDGLVMDIDEPDIFHGQYRIIRLLKTSHDENPIR